MLPFIVQYFQALGTVTGRGLYLLFLGFLSMSLLTVNKLAYLDFMSIGSGVFALLAGSVMACVGINADRALSAVRCHVDSEDKAREAFLQADEDHNGTLNIDELSMLVGRLGSTLNRTQLQAIMRNLDSDRSGAVSLEEFLRWWGRGAAKTTEPEGTRPPPPHSVAAIKEQAALAKQGPSIMRVANVAAGAGVCVGGIIGLCLAVIDLVNGDAEGGWVAQIALLGINTWLVLFACLTLLIELKSYFCGTRTNAFVQEHALFLDLVIGRAVLYLFVGTLAIALYNNDLSNLLLVAIFAGLFMIGVGAINLLAGIAFNSQLSTLRAKLGADASASFRQVDTNGDGCLDMEELTAFCQATGLQLDHRQWEMLLAALDKDGDGQISVNEFNHWWSLRDL